MSGPTQFLPFFSAAEQAHLEAAVPTKRPSKSSAFAKLAEHATPLHLLPGSTVRHRVHLHGITTLECFFATHLMPSGLPEAISRSSWTTVDEAYAATPWVASSAHPGVCRNLNVRLPSTGGGSVGGGGGDGSSASLARTEFGVQQHFQATNVMPKSRTDFPPTTAHVEERCVGYPLPKIISATHKHRTTTPPLPPHAPAHPIVPPPHLFWRTRPLLKGDLQKRPGESRGTLEHQRFGGGGERSNRLRLRP